jgi:uncharacterized membrane protein
VIVMATSSRAVRSFALRAVTLGFVTGLRSMTPFALLALRRDASESRAKPRWLRSRGARIGFALAALGEYVGDKLPMTPSRLAPGPLVGRAVSGAMAGALVARDVRGSAWTGALLGAGGAVLGSFAGNKLRAQVVKVSGLPDPFVAIVEDAIALGLGLAAA